MGNAEGVACPAPGTTVLIGEEKAPAVVEDSPEEVTDEEVATTVITVRMLDKGGGGTLGEPIEVPLSNVSPAEAPRKPYNSFEEEQLVFLTSREVAKLVEADSTLSDYVRNCAADPGEVLCFVRQCFYNVAGEDWSLVEADSVAQTMLEALKWRDTHDAPNITSWECPADQLRALPGGLFGRDCEGRPVVWTPVFAVIPTADGVTDELVQKVELQRQVRITEALRTSGAMETTNVIDIQGLGMNALSYVSTLAKWGEVSEKYYPCRVSSTMIINAPWGFSTAFATIKPLFGARTAALLSVHAAGEETAEALRSKLPEESIPKFYGGSATVNGDDDVMCESFIFPGGLSPAAEEAKSAFLEGGTVPAQKE